ncbi:3-hydroxyisobutyryl-CoA hydrolase protein 1 [Spatholobus suberectus]|nr:3-hydroxyisobutyryl-CoA hydrolase protein 1 [Spatholobus suberectus]
MMQSRRAGWWLLLRKAKLSLNTYRNLSTSQHVILDNPNHNQVLVEGNGCSRMVILNRPSALNALNTNMVATLHKLYRSWEDNPDIGFVMVKGSGRAFAAGGDIVALCHLINKGNMEACKEFFRTAYSFMYLIGTYLKPHVALLNGITMGGGAGVSIPGTFRVATDKTVFLKPIASLQVLTEEFGIWILLACSFVNSSVNLPLIPLTIKDSFWTNLSGNVCHLQFKFRDGAGHFYIASWHLYVELYFWHFLLAVALGIHLKVCQDWKRLNFLGNMLPLPFFGAFVWSRMHAYLKESHWP